MLKPLTRALVPPYRRVRAPSKSVAIVVPASTSEVLTPDEEISLRHLRHFLGPYDKFLIVPRGSGLRLDGLKRIEISRKYFGSMRAHGRLLYNVEFYRQFEDYQYILMYHLDALVLRDELLSWCRTGIDYIGAPWIPCSDTPWVKTPGVGNGGFALMKIASVLEVLHNRYRLEPSRYWEDRLAQPLQALPSLLRRPRQLVPRWLRGSMTKPIRQRLHVIDRGVEINRRSNDIFWGNFAVKYLPEFKVADWRTGLRFAFEAVPRQCFEFNDHQMPFGGHAWPKFDRSFWEPHLLRG